MSHDNRLTYTSTSKGRKRATPLNIALYRKRAGLSQKAMAAQLHIRPETLSRVENGQQYLTEGMEQRIAMLLSLSDDERNHMLGLPLGAGTGAARRAPRPGSDSTIRLVAGRRVPAGTPQSQSIAPHSPVRSAGGGPPATLALVGQE